MRQRAPIARFVVTNALVWLAMTVLLVVVPEALAHWIDIQVARVLGWALACGVWVVTVEAQWKARYGPLARLALQFVLWVAAALTAMAISDLIHP